MKKKFKKLSLNTETLRDLSPSNLQDAAGGITETDLESNCINSMKCSWCTRACTLCTRGCNCVP